MRKLFLLSVVAGLFFAACGNHSEPATNDSTAAAVDTATAVADTAAADTAK